MLAYVFYHATVTELIWCAIGLVGAAHKIYNFHDAVLTMKAIDTLNGKNIFSAEDARFLAFGHLRREALRIAESITILGAGAILIVAPNPPNHVTTTIVIVTIAFFTLEVIDTTQSILDAHQRRVIAKRG